jgi:hypothetical protein
MNPHVAWLIVGVSVGACANPFHGDVDTVVPSRVSAHADVPDSLSLHAHSGHVGQWALYDIIDDGTTVGYELFDITKGKCGIWFEVAWVTRDHRTVSKVCYHAMPDLDQPSASWLPLVRVAVMQEDDFLPVVIDLRHRDSSRNDLDLASFQSTFDAARWRHYDLPRNDINVTSGRFTRAVQVTNERGDLTMWFHPAVPITSMVKSHASDGRELSLVAFGEQDAVAAIPNYPEASENYVSCDEDDRSLGVNLLRRTASFLRKVVCQRPEDRFRSHGHPIDYD